MTGGLEIRLCPDDVRHGWTLRMLAHASCMYRRGDRAPIVVDGYRRYERARQRSRAAQAIYGTDRTRTTRGRVDIAEVVTLLHAGDTLETVAVRFGVSEEWLITRSRRRGTREQHARVLAAAAEMRDIRIGLAS